MPSLDPPLSENNVVVSPTGIIHVLGYTPTEGERGVPITVRIHFHPDLADAMYVRLVVGHKAVATKVRELHGVSYGRWQLDALVPPFDKDHFSSTKVIISVQALNDDNAILDSVAFGEFSYWSSACTPQRPLANSTQNNLAKLPRLHIPSTTDSICRRSNTSQLPTPSPTTSNRSPFPIAQPKMRLHRRMKPQSLIRTKHATTPGEHDNLYAQTPILDLVTPLSTICTGWSPAELHAGRRLVRFAKVQDGRRLIVSCEAIRQEDYCESDSVISCIYREEANASFVTSVDVIYLLERLTNGEFPVEEKNRIRRNLEGLRPTTVSKHKPGFGDFFQRIMEFPDPKPRNIEKDLKVFEWNLLGQALEKILSKYSIYTSPTPEHIESPESERSSSHSPELVALQLSYPREEVLPPDRPSKFESVADDYNFLAPSGGAEVFPSPVGSATTASSSSSSVFAPFTRDATEKALDHAPSSWSSDMKSGEITLDNFNILTSYEALEPIDHVHNFPDHSLEFNPYDNFNFQSISDNSLADQYI